MKQSSITVTVFFEVPYWIGIIEWHEDQHMTVCRIIFGSEPKDYEVYDYMKRCFDALQFSPEVDSDHVNRMVGYKRMQRYARRQVNETGIGTKSQQALKAAQEEHKKERRQNVKSRLAEEKEHRFQLKQKKKKAKHRGR